MSTIQSLLRSRVAPLTGMMMLGIFSLVYSSGLTSTLLAIIPIVINRQPQGF